MWRLSWRVISFSNVSKQHGKQVLFVDASFQLNPGEKVGLVGPNGSGKTTLFRMIVGEESLSSRGSTRFSAVPNFQVKAPALVPVDRATEKFSDIGLRRRS
jgi:ATPase subunit of ABC transporter with duplicated ATPase domains